MKAKKTVKPKVSKAQQPENLDSALYILEELVLLAKEKGLTEIKLEFSDFKARLSWQVEEKFLPLRANPGILKTPEKKFEPNTVTVPAPLTGVFCRSPMPGTPPFVEVGDKVQPAEVLCLIEAMKLMNEITSEVAGEVRQVFPQNGDLVEKGSLLFLIKKD